MSLGTARKTKTRTMMDSTIKLGLRRFRETQPWWLPVLSPYTKADRGPTVAYIEKVSTCLSLCKYTVNVL